MKTKICSKCGKEKDLSCFWINRGCKDGKTTVCKECYKSPKTKLKNQKLSLGFKLCSKCNIEKKLSNFYKKNKLQSSNLSSWCKKCTQIQNDIWHKQHKKEIKILSKNYLLKTRYGITLEQYNQLFKEQNGVCAICGNKETSLEYSTQKVRTLAVDHNHETGKVRGLLCGKCNRGIGYFNEKIQTLKQAINYLEK